MLEFKVKNVNSLSVGLFFISQLEHRAAYKLDRFAVIDIIYKDRYITKFVLNFVTQESLKNLKNAPNSSCWLCFMCKTT
jgi:hypothetical protein